MAGEAAAPSIPTSYELEGLAIPAELDRVHALVERARVEHPEVSARDLMLFETALIEVAGNVVEHGRPPGRVHWHLVLRVGAAAIEAELIDTSEASEIPLDTEMPDEAATSGRGIAIAVATLDSMTLRRVGNENHWLLVRRLPRRPHPNDSLRDSPGTPSPSAAKPHPNGPLRESLGTP